MTTISGHLSVYALISLFLFSSGAAAANPQDSVQKPQYHDHQLIIDTAKAFLRQNIDTSRYSRTEISMGRLDKRLRLAHCANPLSSTLAPGSNFAGKTTVHVKCDSDAPWTVYINANISLYAEVVHTALPLNKGHILTEDDLIMSEENLSQLRYGYFSHPEQLIGKQLRRRLSQNRILKVNYVKAPTLVKRGEMVSIVAENHGYSVKMSGIAMSNGSKGERIQVKNASSRRIIEGTVQEAGIISIN